MSRPPHSRPEATSRRIAARRRRRFRRAGRATATVAALAVLTGAALVATDTIRFPRGGEPRLMSEANALHAPGGLDVDPGPPPTNVRPLSADAPLRLWIGGDSLAGSLGPSLGVMTAATGVVKPVYSSRVSSGLSSPSFYDWPRHGAEQMRTYDPEAVVFVVGTNDFPVVADRPVGRDGEPAWRSAYAARVEEMLGVLIGSGRDVYWVGAPVMREDDLSSDVREINDVARTVVERHPEVTYVDTYRLFSDEQGEYSASLPNSTGDTERVRAGDGIHLTPAGGDRLAEAVYQLLDARWNIHAQTVPGHRQPITEVEGSTRLPGTGRRVTSGQWSGDGSGSSGEPTVTSTTTTTAPSEEPTEQLPTEPEPPDLTPPTSPPPNTSATTVPTTAPPAG